MAPRTRPLSLCIDPEAMSYRELQQACKAQGLPAKGKADILRQQLLAAAEQRTYGAAAPAPTPCAGALPPLPLLPRQCQSGACILICSTAE